MGYTNTYKLDMVDIDVFSALNDSGWFAGLFEFVGAIIGTLFIWLLYFATMYFIK